MRSETVALLAAAALFGSAGCEETVPLEGLPYVERPVIAARVAEGTDTVFLSVTRTLPTTVAYDPSGAAVVDAGVTLRSDGTDYAAFPSIFQSFQALAAPCPETLRNGF